MSSDRPIVQSIVRAFAPACFAALAVGAVGCSDGTRDQLKSRTENPATETQYVIPVVDPDWAPVHAYIEAQQTLINEINEARKAAANNSERREILKREKMRSALPDIEPAIAAAAAIVRLGGSHERTVDAADFLVTFVPTDWPGVQEATKLGINALIDHGADYDRWANALRIASVKIAPGEWDKFDRLLESFDDVATAEPWVAAYARNTAARRRLDLAKSASVSESERAQHRQRGIEILAGFSDDIESRGVTDPAAEANAEFDREKSLDQEAVAILYSLTYLTPGGVLPALDGKHLDGTSDSTSTYAGQVILIDFWASWCAPCIDEIPKLTALFDELPSERFEILSISDDRTLEDVATFQNQYPMPWTNWFDGLNGPATQALGIYAFPTYILVDENGTIVAWENELTPEFMGLIRDTVTL